MHSNQWPLSQLSRDLLTSSIGRFLRTHRNGLKALADFMNATPADRTEAQFEQECAQAREAHEAEKQRIRDALAGGCTVPKRCHMSTPCSRRLVRARHSR